MKVIKKIPKTYRDHSPLLSIISDAPSHMKSEGLYRRNGNMATIQALRYIYVRFMVVATPESVRANLQPLLEGFFPPFPILIFNLNRSFNMRQSNIIKVTSSFLFTFFRFSVDHGRLEELDLVKDVHVLTGLIKLFFR